MGDNAPPPPPPLVDRWVVWNEWVERNARPKIYCFPKKKRKITRFQKKGPMSPEDWGEFKRWSKIAALPKDKQPKDRFKKKEKIPKDQPLKAGAAVEKPSTAPSPLAEMYAHLKKLARAPIRRCVKKYVYPKKEFFKFSPFILNSINHEGNLKMEPSKKWKKMKVRPFHGITIPLPFLDRALEADFFRDLRFPVVKKALKYRPSKMMKALINPDLHEAPRHCCKINPAKYPLPRQRMRRCHWTWHLLHLQYLALPKTRLDPPEPCVPPRKKVPLSKLKKRIIFLAKPKYPPPKIIKDRCKKKRKRRPPKPKIRYVYKPFKKKKGQKPNMARIAEIAKPKKMYSGPKIVKDRDRPKKKKKSKKKRASTSKKRTKPSPAELDALFDRLSQPKSANCSKSQTHDMGPENTYTPNIYPNLKVTTHKRDCKK